MRSTTGRGALRGIVFAAMAISGIACTSTTTGTGSPNGDQAGGSTPSQPGVPKEAPPAAPKPVDPTTDPNAPACTGAPGSLYAINARKLDSTTDIPLCRFQGSVLMIVNVATQCGNTPQYAPLQELYAKYRA